MDTRRINANRRIFCRSGENKNNKIKIIIFSHVFQLHLLVWCNIPDKEIFYGM